VPIEHTYYKYTDNVALFEIEWRSGVREALVTVSANGSLVFNW